MTKPSTTYLIGVAEGIILSIFTTMGVLAGKLQWYHFIALNLPVWLLYWGITLEEKN